MAVVRHRTDPLVVTMEIDRWQYRMNGPPQPKVDPTGRRTRS
jgi:hypothetical protein